jgi:protein required for attachment to host cells
MARNHDKTEGFLLPNADTCIVACSAAEARFYLSERRFGDWTLLDSMNNPDATLREQEFNSDRPGRAFDRFGRGRHAMSPEETARHPGLQTFAHDIAQHLAKEHSAGRFSQLVLIAEPSLLGLLRRKLSASLKRSLCFEVPKNPADFDCERLRALFK